MEEIRFKDVEDAEQQPCYYFKCYKHCYTNKYGYICCLTQMRPVKPSTHQGWVEEFYSNVDNETLQLMFEGREVKEGHVYELVIIDEERDWETGIIDEWSYDFIEVIEESVSK